MGRSTHDRHRLDLRVCGVELRLVPDDRVAQPGAGHPGILRGRTGCSGGGQRHGHRGRLDERGILHFHGRTDQLHGLRRRDVPDGLDRRLRAAGTSIGALPAQVRSLHRPRFHRRPLRLQHGAPGGGDLGALRQLHLRGRTDAGGGRGLFPLPGSGHQRGRRHRHGHRLHLRHPWRHEGDHLDPGGPVLGVDHRLPHSRHRYQHPPDRARLSADRTGFGADRGRLPARQAGQDPRRPRLLQLHGGLRRALGHGQCLPGDPGIDGRHRRTSPRHRALLHGEDRAGGTHIGLLGPVLHRPALSDGAGHRSLRPLLHDRLASGTDGRAVAGLVPKLGEDRSDPVAGRRRPAAALLRGRGQRDLQLQGRQGGGRG